MTPSASSLRLAAFLVVFIISGLTCHGQIPNPAFPVGNLSAEPLAPGSDAKAKLVWSIRLPDGENPANYTHFLRQVQYPSMVNWDVSLAQSGEMESLELTSGGSRFELWTVRNFPLTSYLLSSTVYSNDLPKATVTIQTEDPYPYLPRTRADRPFYVNLNIHGLGIAPELPDSAKSVNLLRHVQSYGTSGDGNNLDRYQATLLFTANIALNGRQSLVIPVNSVPGTDRAKVRGEERFSVFTVADYQNPDFQISSQTVQIWPVADGSIAGVSQGQSIGPVVPTLTFTLHDLYPSSTTWAQVYKGTPLSGVTGRTISGSAVSINSAAPQNRVVAVGNYLAAFDSDGEWTMELLTQTPFGTDRLAYVTFNVQGTASPRDSWRLAQFGSAANQGDGADLNDHDGDGLPNLIEYAFGLDPKRHSEGMMPTWRVEGGYHVMDFRQPDDVGGITYSAEWSPSLLPGSWRTMEDSGIPPQHRFRVSQAGNPSIFMRMKITGQ